MKTINNIKDAAVAFWRLQKWVSSVEVDRKIAAESSLRTLSDFLKENKVDVIDLTGQYYDPGLSVEVLFFEDEDSEDDSTPLITEMVKPIIIQNGSVLEYGQVVIAKNPNVNKSFGISDDSYKAPDNDEMEITTDANNQNIQVIDSKSPVAKAVKFVLIVIVSIVIVIGFIRVGSQIQSVDNRLSELLEEQTEISMLLDLDNDISELSYKYNIIDDKINELLELPKPTLTSAEPISHDQSDIISWEVYIIESGDTLHSICSKKGINYYSWQNIILSMNGINDASKISIDQIILLPVIAN